MFVPATHIAATSRITFQLEGAVELFNDLMTPCIRAFELSSAKSTHAVEYVGIYFSWNHVDDSDPMLAAIHEILGEQFEIIMTDPPLRPIIRKLLRALVKKVRVASGRAKPAGKQVRLHSTVMALSDVRFLMGKA